MDRNGISPAKICRDPSGAPASEEYGDIYASRDGASSQARFVFLKGNDLPNRWQGKDQFVILENGFGLGTNFLTTLQAWRSDPKRPKILHFVSIEKHPPTADQIQTFCDPTLSVQASELAQQWPKPFHGVHRLFFDDNAVVLTLYFMDSKEAAKKLTLGFDALFLDGFSPKVNPDMWNPSLLKALAKYARKDATLATWCVSGPVRKALEESGFSIEKVPGFAHKREMTRGRFAPKFKNRRFSPPEPVPSNAFSNAVVIGAGLSGAAVTAQLRKRGIAVTVIDEGCVPAAGASAIRWGMLHAQLSSDDNYLSRLTRNGFETTSGELKNWPDIFRAEGLFQMAKDDEEFQHWKEWKKKGHPLLNDSGFLEIIDSEEATERLGVDVVRGGLWHHGAGLVQASVWVRERLSQSGATVLTNTRVDHIRQTPDGWDVFGDYGQLLAHSPLLIVAAGEETSRLVQRDFPVINWRGRISLLCEDDLPTLKGGITGHGYVLRSEDGWVTCGASYEEDGKVNLEPEVVHRENLKKLNAFFADTPDVVATGFFDGKRAVAVDRLPVVGSVFERPTLGEKHHKPVKGLFVCFAMASRAITLSELCASTLVSEIFGEPLPIEADLRHAIGTERFVSKEEH